MDDKRETLEEGTIGFFWPWDGSRPELDTDTAFRGHAQLKNGVLAAHVLNESPDWQSLADDPIVPNVLIAITTDDALIFTTPMGTRRTQRSHRASSQELRYATVFGAVDFDGLASSCPTEVSAHFLGLGLWAGYQAVARNHTFIPGTSRVRTASIDLVETPTHRVRISPRVELELSSAWEIRGPDDQLRVRAPLSIAAQSDRVLSLHKLLRPLQQVQDLISLSYDRFIRASHGTAQFRYTDSVQHTRSWMWNQGLMVQRGPDPQAISAPLVTLADLGGPRALPRWIRLVDANPVAIGALVSPFRLGALSPALALLETAAAIENWVRAAQARNAAWAAGRMYADQLAAHVGKPFSDWIGEHHAKWGKAFWDAYNTLKHNPSLPLDPRTTSTLAASGRFLLTAAVLNRVAGNQHPARTIFGRYELANLQERIQKLLE